jgi:hypothetical protein
MDYIVLCMDDGQGQVYQIYSIHYYFNSMHC